jgi:hypothetical protein
VPDAGRATAARFLAIALPVAIAALVLWPVLGTGLYGDDASDANLNGAIAFRQKPWNAFALSMIASWVHDNGRFFPAYVFEKFAVFHVLTDVEAYKLFLLALTIADLLVFLLFVRALAGTALASLATLIAALSLQMRGYHDALYAYNGMVQIMFLVLIASLWCWRANLLGRGRAFGIAALALYVLNALTYEFSYLFFPLYAAIAPRGGRGSALRAALPFAAITLAFAIVSAVLRRRATLLGAGSAYAFGPDPAQYALTLARQLAAALPLSYFLWNPSRIFPPPAHAFDESATYHVSGFVAGMVALGAFIVLQRFARERRTAPSGDRRLMLSLLGAGLWVLPGVLMSLSVKYQRELQWGIGYLPVTIECFGFALVATLAVGALLEAVAPRWRVAVLVVLAAAFGLTAAVTRADNQRLALELAPWRESRDVVAAAMRVGIASRIPTGATLFVESNLPWLCFADDGCPDYLDGRYFVYETARKWLDLRPWRAPSAPTGGPDYLLQYARNGPLAFAGTVPLRSRGPMLVYVESLIEPPCDPAYSAETSGAEGLRIRTLAGDRRRWALLRVSPGPGTSSLRAGWTYRLRNACAEGPVTAP